MPTPRTVITPRMLPGMAEAAPCALLRLLSWLSPSFPVGAFAYSHGIETAVDAGLIRGAADLERWIDAIITHGAGFADAVFVSHAWRAAANGDSGGLRRVQSYAAAFRGSAEAALESGAQGRAFLAALGAGWPELAVQWEEGAEPAYACVVGAAAGVGGIPLPDTALAFLHAFAANLVSAGVRLIPLGQRDGVRILAALAPVIARAAAAALAIDLDDLGTATVRVDWTMARHETQHVRLFRS
ncbi:MAG: urease accessory UreF family protein [Defluviicoccus sp.]